MAVNVDDIDIEKDDRGSDFSAEEYKESQAAMLGNDEYVGSEPPSDEELSEQIGKKRFEQDDEEDETSDAPSDEKSSEDKKASDGEKPSTASSDLIDASAYEELMKRFEKLEKQISELMKRNAKAVNSIEEALKALDDVNAFEEKNAMRIESSAKMIERGNMRMQNALKEGTEKTLAETSKKAVDAVMVVADAARDHINELQIESTKRVSEMMRKTRPERFMGSVKCGAAMLALAIVAAVAIRYIIF